MENIFEIRFSFEQHVKDNVILKFSNKQGGAYNVFFLCGDIRTKEC